MVVKYCASPGIMSNWLIVDHKLNGSKKSGLLFWKRQTLSRKWNKWNHCSAPRSTGTSLRRVSHTVFVHHISRKVGTNWRGQRAEPQECYFMHNFHGNDQDNGLGRSREDRVEETCDNHPAVIILSKGKEVAAVNRFSLAGRANALTPDCLMRLFLRKAG